LASPVAPKVSPSIGTRSAFPWLTSISFSQTASASDYELEALEHIRADDE
jgi:hypothetical protein